ncbi:FAD-NAD(P)-binding protein [Erythrobacter sp. R86502]|uniref:FAD-NAD(P)-binding protein n=1 Tax=Erythrobacter sp. R86502 TaxID=3093846 RepID=UPI0036D34388
MRKIGIVGSGPTGIYTIAALIAKAAPIEITLFEQGDRAGVGMPYDDDSNTRLMLANIASIEIPPIGQTYLEWLRSQSADWLRRYGVDKDTLHDRQFLPRLLLGQYFRDQLLWLVEQGQAHGIAINIRENCRVSDLEARADGVALWTDADEVPVIFDWVAIATGHVWPDADEATRAYFPSPWSGLVDAPIPPSRIGIMGTSLSAIDAAMAVVSQHGSFVENDAETVTFACDKASAGLSITLMSRTGILPEADFYCPIPYEPLAHATADAIAAEIDAGSDGLLGRCFALFVQEIMLADPWWAARISLNERTADDFADAYFADRIAHDPFRWAQFNLSEVEHNKRNRITVAWRYAILRMHEVFQDIVPALDEEDRDRFDSGLSRVFMDNYAAIPSQSIRRMLALHRAGILTLLELGSDYDKNITDSGTTISVGETEHQFDIFIDARGQKPLETKDLPFPRLRDQLLAAGLDIPSVCEDYSLYAPANARGRIALGALPYLLHDQPFVQGITAGAEIGTRMADMTSTSPSRRRRMLAPVF